MVLETATDPSSSADFASDIPQPDNASPDSDINPNELQATYNLNLSTLPRANFIGATLFGWTEALLRQMIAHKASATAQRLRRMPTQDEFNAIAYHTAKAQAVASYGVPIGVLAGAYRCYETRENYKFPFVKPPESFNPHAVVLGGRTWLTGDRARIFWHALRFTAYGICGGWFVGLCFTAYAASVMTVGELTDPRLKELNDVIREAAKARSEQRGVTQPKQVGITGQGDTSAGELWKRHRTSIGAQDTQTDDASPSAGQQETEFAQSMAVEERLYGNNAGSREMGGASGNQAVDRTPPPPPKQTSRSRAAARAKANDSNSEPSPAGGFYDNYDDASPTAMDAPPATSADSTSGGSTWERIRREAAATEPGARSRRRRKPPQPANQRGDSAGADDREQAQREFDAQLERERQGGSFGGGGKGREW